MDDATRALAGRGEATKASNETAPSQGTFAAASDQQPAGQPRRD
jgi:hypothetical protein